MQAGAGVGEIAMIFVTERNKGGRFGHRVMNIMTPLIVSKLFKANYIHTTASVFDDYFVFEKTSLSEVGQARIHVIDTPCWPGLSYEEARNLFDPILRARVGDADHLLVIDDCCRIHLPHAYEWFAKGLIAENVYEDVVSVLREGYRKAGTGAGGKGSEAPGAIRIAVHIRRGDLFLYKSEDPFHIRYLYPISYYRAVVEALRAAFARFECRFHLYSEARESEDIVAEFGGQENEGIALHIGQPFSDDFHGMIGADVFVMANSAMSMIIAYLSRGMKVYLPNYVCRVLPPDQFFAADKDGTINDESLRALRSRMEAGGGEPPVSLIR